MTTHENAISDHYSHGNLLAAILSALKRIGKSPGEVGIDDLAPVDEFHIGGREATEHFIAKLNFQKNHHILDFGCGLGGAARYVSKTYNVFVTGIDLTPEFVDTGNVLNEWVKLKNQVNLEHRNVLNTPYPPNSFNAAYMIHVGMNIEDKPRLFEEVYRMLTPGAPFGIYDIMIINGSNIGSNDIDYPVPWANTKKTSFLESPEYYSTSLQQAGFELTNQEVRDTFARSFFTRQRKNAEAPPALGLHTLIGADTKIQFDNMIKAIFAEKVAPVEMVVRKM